MKKTAVPVLLIFSIFLLFRPTTALEFESDIIPTSEGDLTLTFIGHGTLMAEFGGLVIHVDPVSSYADYTALPKADLILITHEHGDHLDPEAIGKIIRPGTEVILSGSCLEKHPDGRVMRNGERIRVQGIVVEAVPAYNIEHKRSSGAPFHPKGAGNGYVLEFGDKRIYIAGDTEIIPEMKDLEDIEVAFLPMNLPYTMSPEMAAAAARSFMPRILYPYHYWLTDPQELVDLLADVPEIEVRIRELR